MARISLSVIMQQQLSWQLAALCEKLAAESFCSIPCHLSSSGRYQPWLACISSQLIMACGLNGYQYVAANP